MDLPVSAVQLFRPFEVFRQVRKDEFVQVHTVKGIQIGDDLLDQLLVIFVPMVNTVLDEFAKGRFPFADLLRVL
jgi:hypothetical protein